MAAGEIQSAHRPESFRGSSLFELESLVNRLDAQKIFGRRAPLHVDLGCGDGAFLCVLAQRMPEKNFLGIERLLGRFRSAAVKAAKIRNVRVLRMESSYVVRYLLPPRSVGTGGNLIIATDHLSYLEKIKEIAQANLDLAVVDPASVDLPQSRFARVFQQQGVAIHWLELRNVSPVR